MSPRKRKPKAQSQHAEHTPVGEAISEFLESRKLKEAIEPERPMPEPKADQAPTGAETATGPDKPARQKSWGETVRPWTSHGRDTGVKHVTAKVSMGQHGVMEATGIQFEKGKERTAEEKREMEAIGLKFYMESQAWLKPNRGNAIDETQDMARRFADRRRQMDAEFLGR